jgi:hypothetical protein
VKGKWEKQGTERYRNKDVGVGKNQWESRSEREIRKKIV